MKHIFLSISFLFGLTLMSNDRSYDSAHFFTFNATIGEKLGNIFSRTISFKSDDFPEIVYRYGGTGIYTDTRNNPATPGFDGEFRYDGRPASRYKVEFTDGGKTVSYNGKFSVVTDGSGLLFNPLIWGVPPPKIRKGGSWQVEIAQAWELAGPGMQKVTVMDIDNANHTVTLKREGSGEGYYDNDFRQLTVSKDGKSIKMEVTPGATRWKGNILS